jgi:hypothetical protein
MSDESARNLPYAELMELPVDETACPVRRPFLGFLVASYMRKHASDSSWLV